MVIDALRAEAVDDGARDRGDDAHERAPSVGWIGSCLEGARSRIFATTSETKL
jgi:hypothetical protein